MKPRPTKLPVTLSLAAAVGLLLAQAGCSLLQPKADLTQFYVLRASSPDFNSAAQTPSAGPEVRVGPGSIAAYLEVTPIAVQDETNRIKYLGRHHWAEPLPQGINRVLGEHLAKHLDRSRVTLYPEPATSAANVELRYTINRFEGDLGGPVTLDVAWHIYQRPSGTVQTGKRAVYAVPAGGSPGDVAAYVDQLSRVISLWAADVAAVIPSSPAEP